MQEELHLLLFIRPVKASYVAAGEVSHGDGPYYL